jgi:hypothetical protein
MEVCTPVMNADIKRKGDVEWRCSERLRPTEGGLHWKLRSARLFDTSDVYLYSGPGFSIPVLQLVALFHARSIDAFSQDVSICHHLCCLLFRSRSSVYIKLSLPVPNMLTLSDHTSFLH